MSLSSSRASSRQRQGPHHSPYHTAARRRSAAVQARAQCPSVRLLFRLLLCSLLPQRNTTTTKAFSFSSKLQQRKVYRTPAQSCSFCRPPELLLPSSVPRPALAARATGLLSCRPQLEQLVPHVLYSGGRSWLFLLRVCTSLPTPAFSAFLIQVNRENLIPNPK